jgi:hypothetical protein
MLATQQQAPIAIPALKTRLERLEARMFREEQIEIPLTHRFAPGVYLREVFMPAGAIVLGHEHKTEHFNIILKGRASVMMGGEVHEIIGPCTLISKAGVRKALYIHEDMIWQTVHPTHETDLKKLENELITKSETYLSHHAEVRKLIQHVGLS